MQHKYFSILRRIICCKPPSEVTPEQSRDTVASVATIAAFTNNSNPNLQRAHMLSSSQVEAKKNIDKTRQFFSNHS